MKKETSEVDEISIVLADESHLPYVKTILTTIEEAAKVRGTGIAKRSPEYIESKMKEGKAIINNSGLNVIAAENLKDGAQKIVKAVKG